ncbi:TVP38/TMEM64 family protein [Magnetovibrio sp.]|uniref:TVP38/TMEM64 family protein n=1 Tax=Magnetovibrio sp. TaxID=2024836 RepID=UPI002F91E06E
MVDSRQNGGELPRPRDKGLKRFAPIAVVLVGVIAFFASGAHNYLSFEALARHRADLLDYAQQHAVAAVVVFMLAYVVVIGFSLPGGVWLTLAGGFVFGGWATGIYVVFSATVGATLIFLAARYAFADLFRARAGSALAKMEAGFCENAFNYLLVLRLVPLFPFWLVNLVPALLDVRLRTYVVATFLGIIPGTFVYAHVGAGLGAVFDSGGEPDLGVIFQPAVLLPILALAALSLVPIAYQKLKGAS